MATTAAEEGPKRQKSRRNLASLVSSTLKILVTGIVIPIGVSLVTSFYVNTHILRPRLVADYSSGEVMVMPIQGRPDEYIVALVDLFPGFRAPLPEGTTSLDSIHGPLAFTGGEILSAKKLRFQSARDYVVDLPASSSRMMKIMLANNGFATAHQVSVGVNFQEDAACIDVIPSPNIKITSKIVAGTGINPPFIKVTIDRLGPAEKATLTVSCVPKRAARSSPVDSPFIKIQQNFRYEPILYANSEEGSVVISPNGISWRDAAKWETANIPNTTAGFWASRIHLKTGASAPTIEDMKELDIEYELVDETGKHTGNGTWRLRPPQ